MPLANGEVFAGYTILRLLGSGGMGEVYLTPPAPPPTATASAPAPAPPAAPAQPVAVIGANCAPASSSGVTASGSSAYCSRLQNTDAYVWSLTPGDVDNPNPAEAERPVRLCVEQTGQTRLRCREDIRRSTEGR